MIGELFINDKDAYTSWGISMDEDALAALMTPPPMKDFVENKSRLQHGKLIISGVPLKDERDVQFSINITAKTREDFLSKYNSFCIELATGFLNIKTKYQTGIIYKTVYRSCQSYSQFDGRIGKFLLKLNEPNPNNRG